MAVEYSATLWIVGGNNQQHQNLSLKISKAFPGIRCSSNTQWLEFAELHPTQTDIILAFLNPNQNIPLNLLKTLNIPIIVIGPHDSLRQAVTLLKNGVNDYLTFQEAQSNELINRLRPHIPRAHLCDERTLQAITNIFLSINETTELTTLLKKNLHSLLLVANSNRGLILLESNGAYIVGAYQGLSEDHAVLVAALDKGLIAATKQTKNPTTFHTPKETPGDDPVIWCLHEANLEHGYVLPLIDPSSRKRHGVAILATQNQPLDPLPTTLDKAAVALAASISLAETLALAKEQKRAGDIRLENQNQTLGLLYKMISQFSEQGDLHSVANHLVETISIFIKPDIVGFYAASGRLRVHEIHEAHPLPLTRVHNFESWFNGRLCREFGPDSLRDCPSTSISKGQRLALATTRLNEATPQDFELFEWILIPPNAPPMGAIALAASTDPGYGQAQRELLHALADHVAVSIKSLAHSQDERQTLVQSLLDGLPVGVALLDAYGRIVLANQHGMSLLRKAGNLSKDERLLELCGEPFYDATLGIEQSQHGFSRERRVGSSIFFISIASVPLPMPLDPTQPSGSKEIITNLSSSSNSNGYAIAIRDVTKAHEIRQQLAQAEKLSSLGVMVSGVAHELNNPLTSIRGYSELLLEAEQIPPAIRPDLQRIRTNSERCARIVSDLLSFSRKKGEENLCEINLAALLGEVFDLLFLQLKTNKILLKYEFAPKIPRVAGDPHQLQQVFVNLINNAQQAISETGQHGNITVKLQNADDKVIVIVEDDGPGIRPEHQARIFDPFFSTKSTKGTGLGLSICYGIIRDHGGTIRASSPPNQGAAFTIELPATTNLAGQPQLLETKTPTHLVPQEATPQTTDDSRESPSLVLVVDNTPVIRRLVMDVLTNAGYVVDVAANAEEAMATLKFMDYDVILSSLELAGLGGENLYHVLNDQSENQTPFIFMINARELNLPRNAFLKANDAPAILEKPFSHQKLIALVESISNNHP